MALYTGNEVSRSHTMVVSRWFVIPIQAMSSPVRSALAMTSAATDDCEYQISGHVLPNPDEESIVRSVSVLLQQHSRCD